MEEAIIKDSYRFIKDYKSINHFRRSFNDLAIETFGIDFEPWYRQGFWNDHYVCYSALHNGQVVSNVSVSRMQLLVDGKPVNGVQIGTVMTSPEHRRRGLAEALILRVFKDYDPWADLYFLAADEEAWPLYERCGFRHRLTQTVEIDLGYYTAIDPPKPIMLTADKLMDLKKSALPLSKTLCAVDDTHVLMFYYTLGFNKALYSLDDHIILIYEKEGDTLHLYGLFSQKITDLESILPALAGEGVSKVQCHYTPDQKPKGTVAVDASRQGWMVRACRGIDFPPNSVFPSISKT